MSLTAFLLVILAAFLHALWNFTAKKASGNLYVVFIGLLMACVVFLPFFLIYFSLDHLTNAIFFILATGILHAVYFFLLCKAYKHEDISVVYPVARGSGVAGTALVAYFFLQESISPLGIAGILFVSFGAILIGLKFNQKKDQFNGMLYAFSVGLTIISFVIVDKIAVGKINPALYIYSMAFGTTFFLIPFVISGKRHEFIQAWKKLKLYSFIIGVGSMGTYLIILFVFQMANVSYVVATRELSVVIGSFLGIKFLKEPFSIKKIIGIAFIVLGMITIKMVTS